MEEKTFTLEQVLNLLISMEQALSTELFKSSSDLIPEDFLDLLLSKAQELGIEKEYDKFLENDPNYTG